MFYRVHFVGHLVKQMCPVVLADVLRKPLHGNEGLGVVVDARDVGEVPCARTTTKKSHENAPEFIVCLIFLWLIFNFYKSISRDGSIPNPTNR
jgi:hypothetical protein